MVNILIIGSGHIGSTLAYACTFLTMPVKIYLYDVNENKRNAIVKDLQDSNKRNQVYSYSNENINYFDFIINCAGNSSLLKNNRDEEWETTKEIATSLIKLIKGFEGIFINVANPNDKLTAYIGKISSLNKNKLFGVGTLLDNARLNDKKALIIGSHGEKNIIISNDENKKHELVQIRQKAWEIIKEQGFTCYGIVNVVFELMKQFLSKKPFDSILCVYHEQENKFYSDCCTLSHNGLISINTPSMTDLQQKELNNIIQYIN